MTRLVSLVVTQCTSSRCGYTVFDLHYQASMGSHIGLSKRRMSYCIIYVCEVVDASTCAHVGQLNEICEILTLVLHTCT